MTLPNSTIPITPGSGLTTPAHLIGSNKYQVVLVADQDGHIQGSASTYWLYQAPRVTTAAATDFLDVFNAAASGLVLTPLAIYPVQLITAASAIIPSFEFHVIRTSAVGTGGTAHTFEGAASPTTGLVNIARPSTADAPSLSASITCRALPTGGATAAAFLFNIALMTEETNTAPYLSQGINWLPALVSATPFKLAAGQGFKIRQITATASTGCNFGWYIVFTVTP